MGVFAVAQPMRALSLLFAIVTLSVHCVARPLLDSTLGLNEVTWQSEPTQIFLGSPSLLRVGSSGRLLATADRFGAGNKGQPLNVSLYVSQDNGSSWAFQTWVLGMYWSNLFQLEPGSSEVFLLGTQSPDVGAPIRISKSSDGGLTWPPSEAAVLFTGTPGPYNTSGFQTGPTPSLLASDGRVYRAMELFPAPHRWGRDYQACIISADRADDLLDPASWTISAPLAFDTEWLPQAWRSVPTNPGYLEGNAVEGPNGEIFNILRLNSLPAPGNFAVVLQYNQSRNELDFRAVINLPGGHTKFVIRRDPVTKLYITLSNNNTDPAYTDQRNILTMCYSTDLFNWTIVGILLSDDTGLSQADSVRYTGFHYVDWQVDGDDLLFLARTAYRGAVSYHNSNRITFKRIVGFRSYLPGGATPAPVSLTPGGSGYTLRRLQVGALAFTDRDYVWTDVPPMLADGTFQFTSLAGGAAVPANISGVAHGGAGDVFVANDGAAVPQLLAAGWESMEDVQIGLEYNDTGRSRLTVLRRALANGERFEVPQAGWAGSILLFKAASL